MTLFIDIETIPDETRRHLWELPELDQLPQVEKLLAGNVNQVKTFLEKYATALTPDYLTQINAFEARNKRRSTVYEALEKARQATPDLISKMSLDPDTLQIIALGYAIDDADPVTLTADKFTESEMLQHFWTIAQPNAPFIGYNNLRFDLRAICIRSILLGVQPSIKLNWRRYNNRQIIDLMEILYPYNRWKGLKKVAKLYGLPLPETTIDGSLIYKMVQVEEWTTISHYLKGDVELTRCLYQKVKGYLL